MFISAPLKIHPVVTCFVGIVVVFRTYFFRFRPRHLLQNLHCTREWAIPAPIHGAVRCSEWLNRAPSQSIDSDEEKFDINLLEICGSFVRGKFESQKCQGWSFRTMPKQRTLGQNHCCATRKRVIGFLLMDEPRVLQSCNRLRKV